MEPGKQPFCDDSSAEDSQCGLYKASQPLPQLYHPYQNSQPTSFAMDPFYQLLADPLTARMYLPGSMAPQSNVRSQQQQRQIPPTQHSSRTAKRRRVDHTEVASSSPQVEQFTSEQLPFRAYTYGYSADKPPTAVTDASVSQCCSSCPGGEPCLEPDCEDGREQVVPCMEPNCDEPVCRDSCIDLYDSVQQHGVLGPRLQEWDETMWNDEFPVAVSSGGPFDNFPLISHEQQQLSRIPNHDPSYLNSSLNAQIQTSQNPNELMVAAGVLTGAGELFNGAQIAPISNFPRQCEWSSCGQLMQDPQDCYQHLHESHFDTQLTWNCPTGLSTCQDKIVNPMDHLTLKHAWTMPADDSRDLYTCPSPTCQNLPGFPDPQQLHHHFDEAHSMPAVGGLHCQWKTCGTVFNDSQALFAHLTEQHQLPIPMSPGEDIDLTPETLTTSRPQDENHLACKWQSEPDSSCGVVCANETDLHDHMKSVHLQSLEKHSGYYCEWAGCRRNSKLAGKKGFSQRGKLERHMASHTGFKCCTCDWVNEDGTICNRQFSAPQALNQHKLLHTGAKPWQCQYCNKTFPQQSAKTIHERTHTKEKPLKCDTCGMRFSESSNLAKHRKIHGEKGPYICEEEGCAKTFHRLDQLKLHLRSHRFGNHSSPSITSAGMTPVDSP